MPVEKKELELPRAPSKTLKKDTIQAARVVFRERAEELLAEGFVDPIEVLMQIAGNIDRLPNGKLVPTVKPHDPKARVAAAAELCSYLYPKLKAIEVTGDKTRPISFSVVSDDAPVPRMDEKGEIILEGNQNSVISALPEVILEDDPPELAQELLNE